MWPVALLAAVPYRLHRPVVTISLSPSDASPKVANYSPSPSLSTSVPSHLSSSPLPSQHRGPAPITDATYNPPVKSLSILPMVWEGSSPLLPTAHRRTRNASTGSFPETHAETAPESPTRFKERERAARLHRPTARTRALRRLPALLGLLALGFALGYYAQLLLFFCHVRLGYTAEVLATSEVALVQKLTASLIEHTQRVVFVCQKTNWDFVGFVASPHTILFAHDDVAVPAALEDTLRVVRHAGVDSYLNLHNKTVTIMSHVHAADPRNHLLKQDDEAVIYWPHYYQCLKKCTDLDACYAGDMHVNIGDASNTNSYVFATGGSYFVGSALLRCMLEKPIFVELDGLDYGEDKTVGKMIHYNRCKVQYVSCKWFNNEEVYSPNAHIKMRKGASAEIREDTVLLGRDEQQQQMQHLPPPERELGGGRMRRLQEATQDGV